MSTLSVVLAQIRPKKGDYAENVRRVGAVLAQVGAEHPPPDLVIFPESALSGYFVEGGVGEVAVTAGTLFRDLSTQHELTGAPPVDVAIGFYERHGNRYHNSALYATLGGSEAGIRHVHRKIFLPTYGLFDEQRFVEPGHDVRAFDTPWGRVALAVCEDSWHSLVGTLAALDGAKLIIVLSASPARGIAPDPEALGDDRARPVSVRRWERVIQRMAEEHGVYVALAQLVGFEGGKGMQGSSTIVAPSGAILVRGPLFQEALVRATLDDREVTRVRAESPLLADLETELVNLLRHPERVRQPVRFEPPDECPSPAGPVQPAGHDVVEPGGGADPLIIDPALTEEWLVRFLQDEVVARRGFRRALVGLSGGVDSTVTAALAVRALGRENVIGVSMPHRSSSPQSTEHARLAAETLGIRLETVDITGAVDAYLQVADGSADDERRGNVMARMRMITLFDLSKKYGAIPLGTGNKSERLMGYFTWHGDDAPPINPLGDLFKTQVRQLAEHLGVPEPIRTKVPSADLVPGQTDEGDLGVPYARLDEILHWLLAGLTLQEIVARGFQADEVALVQRRLNATHWKRRLPTVAMVSAATIGESYLRPVDY